MIKLSNPQKAILKRMSEGLCLIHIDLTPEQHFFLAKNFSLKSEIRGNLLPDIRFFLSAKIMSKIDSQILNPRETLRNYSEQNSYVIPHTNGLTVNNIPDTDRIVITRYKITYIGKIFLFLSTKPKTRKLLEDIEKSYLHCIYPIKIKIPKKWFKRKTETFEQKIKHGKFTGVISSRFHDDKETIAQNIKILKRAYDFGLIKVDDEWIYSQKHKTVNLKVDPKFSEFLDIEEHINSENILGIPNHIWQQMANLEKDYLLKENHNDEVPTPDLDIMMKEDFVPLELEKISTLNNLRTFPRRSTYQNVFTVFSTNNPNVLEQALINRPERHVNYIFNCDEDRDRHIEHIREASQAADRIIENNRRIYEEHVNRTSTSRNLITENSNPTLEYLREMYRINPSIFRPGMTIEELCREN